MPMGPGFQMPFMQQPMAGGAPPGDMSMMPPPGFDPAALMGGPNGVFMDPVMMNFMMNQNLGGGSNSSQ